MNQAAVNITAFDYTSPIIDTVDDLPPQSKLYRNAGDYISIRQQHRQDHLDMDLEEDPNIAEIVPPRICAPTKSPYSFSILQEWEGYVESISKETFTGRLVDVTQNGSIEAEEADFSVDDLDDNDKARICLGAIFRWIIYYRRSPGGTKERSSRIVFRNLPAWNKKELETYRKEADELARALSND